MAVPVRMTTIKSFLYKGVAEEWSNTYHLSGANPADSTAWAAIKVALMTLEYACFPSSVTIIRTYGYNIDSIAANYAYTEPTPVTGALSTTGGVKGPGDSAVWVRWGTGELSSKGKPVYLRKYFHPGVGTSADLDTILPGQKTALQALGAGLQTGGGGVSGRTLVGPLGHATSSHDASSFLTTRTLKRRGRRPS